MKLAVFSTQRYDKEFLNAAHKAHFAAHIFELIYHEFPLGTETVALAKGHDAVCVFVNDNVNATVLEALHQGGTRAVLLRCAGFNNVDLDAAKKLGMFVARVSAYSPEAVAEFAVALMLTLNRKTHKSYSKVRDGNFCLNGLLGFTMHGKVVGLLGTGKIGVCAAKILKGFGCELLAYDPYHNNHFQELGRYVELDKLLAKSDIISLHCPLMDSNRHIIDAKNLARMKDGAMLINTSRGGLIDTPAVIPALKSKKLGSLAIGVYEHESKVFYQDRSKDIVEDDFLQRLMTFPNAIVSRHQGFFTKEALTEISEVTLQNLVPFKEKGGDDANTPMGLGGPPRP